jgi:hypothetical protein
MNELVLRLSEGSHPITVGGPNPTLEELQKRLEEMGYVFIKFTDTRGETDLGVRVDQRATQMNRSQFEQRKGVVHIEGTLTLNYVKVRCIADIELATLAGNGHLVALESV